MRSATAFLLFGAILSAQSANIGYKIDTIAGSDFNGDGGAATLAILAQAEGIAADKTGNLYIADAAANRIRVVSRAGTITTFAGTGSAGYSGDGGPAAAAQLNAPYGILFDGIGNLYVADLGNARVRRIGIDGNITTVAGGGSLAPVPANEGSPATLMMLSAPRNLALDAQNALYISDFTGHAVYRVDSSGTFTTFAGTGAQGFSGDGGPATRAQLSYPAGLAFDRSGNLYIADSGNHVIRQIVNGRIATFGHASTPTGLVMDSLGTLYVADSSAGAILAFAPGLPPATFAIPALDLTFNIDGYLYAAQGNDVIRVVYNAAGTIVAGGGSLASGDGGLATGALLNRPTGVAVDTLGNVYIADRNNNRIRRVAPDGTITTIAGTGVAGNLGDGGPETQATMNAPASVSVDAGGNLFVADSGNHRIRKVTPAGAIVAVPFPGLIAPVYAVADAAGDLIVSDPGLGAIVEETPAGKIVTLADHLNSPAGLAFDSAGDLYFADTAAKRVRKLDTTGTLSDIAQGIWKSPRGIAIDATGDLFVADSGLEQVLRVDTSGQVTVAAGSGAQGFTGDGGDAGAAALSEPWDVAIDSLGVIYVADRANNRVRRLTPAPAAIVAPVQAVTVVNAATLQPGPIAPAMLVEIFGTGLTAADQQNARVTFQTDSGDTLAAQILTIDAAKITLVSPAQISGTSAQIQILNGSTPVAQIPVALAPNAPGLFADSTGQASAINEDGTINSSSNPAPRGSIAVLYGTGQGDGGLPVTVAIGNYPVEVLYAGPVAAYPGLLQINVRLPSGYIAPGNESAVITAGGVSSQAGIFIVLD